MLGALIIIIYVSTLGIQFSDIYTMTCPTTADINTKITKVLLSLQESPPSGGAQHNYNYAPDITSPLSPGFAQTIDHTLLKPDAKDSVAPCHRGWSN